jgi:hypothetical protein
MFLAFGLVAAAPSVAAEVAVVGSHDATLDADGQHALIAAVVAAIDLLGGHDALGPEEVTARIAGREEFIVQQVFGEAGGRLLADGRLLYQQAQPEDAAAMLGAALPELVAAVRYTKSVRELWEAHLLLATMALSEGERAQAAASIAQAIALQPTRRPDPATVPPAVMELFEATLTESTAGAGRVLLPPSVGARVWVDGVEVGAADRKVSALPGTHFVHLLTAEGEVGFEVLQVGKGADAAASLKTSPPQLGAPGQPPAQRAQLTGSLYAALGRLSKLDLLLMIGRDGEQLVLQLHAPAVGGFSAPVRVQPSGGLEAVQAGVRELFGRLSPAGLLDPSTTTFQAAPIDPASNPVLGRLLLVPERSGKVTAPLTVELPAQGTPRPPRSDGKKPAWPVAVGVGAGVVVATGVTVLAVLLGGQGNGGTVVVRVP